MHGAAIILLLSCCIAESAPGEYFLLTLLNMCFAFIYAAIWFARGIVRWGANQYFSVRSDPRSWRPWLAAPGLLVMLVVLVKLDVPLWMALQKSEGALETLVARGPLSPPSVERAGVFLVELDRTPEGITLLKVSGSDFVNRSGFAYIPAGTPIPSSSLRFTKIQGEWYQFCDPF